MKNKRNVFIAFILICCLCLSIGYAALTDTLDVEGNVTLNVVSGSGEVETPFEKEFNEDVHFDADYEATYTATSNFTTGVTATVGAQDTTNDANDKLTISVPAEVFTDKNDTLVIKHKIVNDSEDHAAVVTLANGSSQNSNFSISCVWSGGNETSKTIDKGEGAEIEITIKLETAPTEDINAETFEITYNASTPTT